MKIITFLGTGNYSETTYVYEGKRHQTKLFPAALSRFFLPQELLAVVTTKAKDKWLETLQEEMKDLLVRVTPVDIPDGRSEREVWEIFDAMTEHLQKGDRVVFDITHSFRTLPMLAFIAAAYLRVARGVQIEGIYYGAYDARNEQTNESPVFDLTSFLQLLDWTTAAEYFRRTLDGRFLGEMLKGVQQTMRSAETQAQGDLPTKLKGAGQAMVESAQAVMLTQPYAVMDSSKKVLQRLDAARGDAAAYARPFAVLLDIVREEHAPLALADPNDPRQALVRQWRLLDGYFRREQAVQAVTLAREWIVSLLCWRLQRDGADRQAREEVERAFNSITGDQERREAADRNDPLIRSLLEMEGIEEVRSLWDDLTKIRNQIAHCGMLRDKIPAHRLHRNALNLREKVERTAQTFGLTEEEE